MKEILLTREKLTMVDNEDYDLLNEHKWCCSTDGYAWRVEFETGKSHNTRGSRGIYMHRMILDYPYGMEIDHINGNKLDNRRSNLRVVTKHQNHMNRTLYKNNKTGFKGVFFEKDRNKYRSSIRIGGVTKHIGRFDSKEEAAIAYNKEAVKLFGDYANPNRI